MIYVKILKYKGKSGGFSIKESPRWSVSLVNEEKNLEIPLDSPVDESYGHSSLKYALDQAKLYSELLDTPIREFTRHYTTIFEDKEDFK